MNEGGRHRRGCAVLALSRGGCALGRRLAEALEGDFYPCRGRLARVVAEVWETHRLIVCIMASGIVVRSLAPLLSDKNHDPGVVVMDEQGRFAVSLLSGHLGGGNELARRVALVTGGQAVLTTASDVLGLTALDLWCRDLGLTPADKTAFTRAMGRLVDRGSLRLWSRFPLPDLPRDLVAVTDAAVADLFIDHHTKGPERTVLLIPQSLVIGIGCNRGTPASAIAAAVAETLDRHHLDPRAVARLASIDLKADEPGLLAYGRDQGLNIDFFTKDQLNQVEGVSCSAVVERATGAKGVAEPAALLGAGENATLLVAKIKWPDVTTAVAVIADPLANPNQGTPNQ